MRAPVFVTRLVDRMVSAWPGAVRTGWDAILAVVFAPRCAACDRLLEEPAGGPVCGACWAAVTLITPPICEQCGQPLPSWRTAALAGGRCPRCRRARRALDCARAVGPYEGTLRQILHAFKYDGRRSLAAPLAGLMRLHGAVLLDGADGVVPVPLHRSRQRARGFNQAADLAAHLGLPVIATLRRLRRTPSQTDLPAARRHRNVRGAFGVTGSIESLRGRSLVIVDDVSTTGATLEACARALKAAGAGEVRALTAARAVSRRW